MKKSLLIFVTSLVLAAYARASALVDYSTSIVGGQIMIIYTLAANDEDNTLPVFSVKFSGQVEGKYPFPLKTLTGSGKCGIVLGAGTYTNYWNASKDKRRFNPADIKISVEAEDVTKDAVYLCLDLKKNAMRYQNYKPDIFKNQCRTKELWLRRIEPGSFMMGSPIDEPGRLDDETLHEAKLSQAFYISIFETTQAQYKNVAGAPKIKSYFRGATRPVDRATYYFLRGNELGKSWPQDNNVDGYSFFGMLRAKTGGTLLFDLPTEAQWEYACRAGTEKAFNNDTDPVDVRDANLDKLGWYKDNSFDKNLSGKATHPVGWKEPNAFGLYDAHGNVSEWCLDWYGQYGTKKKTNPRGAKSGSERVLRGGNYCGEAFFCRSALREYGEYDDFSSRGTHGFRIALGLPYGAGDEGGEDDALKQSFEFSLSSSESFPVFAVTLYGKMADGTKFLLEDAGTLSGDGAAGIVLGSGSHTVIWRPQGDYTNLVNKLKLEVSYEDVTAVADFLALDLKTFKMRAEQEVPSGNTSKLEVLWLKRVKPGSFTMGVADSDIARRKADSQHSESVKKPFYMGIFETTIQQYKLITETSTVTSDDLTCPAANISHTSFLKTLRGKTGDKLLFELPSEEQWEYVCRAGTTTSLNNGTNLTAIDQCPNLEEIAWYVGNSGGVSHIVGSKAPNRWGFYDMHGNVAERCLNDVLRGGGYDSEAKECRSAGYGEGKPGLRLVLNFDSTEP